MAEYPTPLEPLPLLSRELGRDIFLKRDDDIGPAMGGNKTRKLEYLIADAMERPTRRVVTYGGLQSNHARLTAAAARRFGLEPHIFYFERRPDPMTGNLLLNELLGARMHFFPLGAGGDGGLNLETASRLVHGVALLRLGRHTFIPVGGHSWRGCLGYVRAAIEVEAQVRELGIDNAWLVTAVGSGGTLSGLLAGLTIMGSKIRVLGIDVGKLWRRLPASIAGMATELCHRLDAPHRFEATHVPLIEAAYVGPKYGAASSEGIAAIRRMARCEGIVLDPVYTGKAFAGLVDLVNKKALGRKEPIIFLHTGGGPALFAFSDHFLGVD
jgi:D-cysteine desulfhydrase family pyridoxal phosphate-dependent enzyme